ncbi:MAG: glycosyltransferase family 39 protein [Candidatus Hydrogenedentes bacterium]|nr:glycosyltransferase family 39 protein [Candidatus Hydrogenedentota bacterium]
MAKLSSKQWEVAFLIAILCIAAALRLYRIEDESVWYDEVVSTASLDQPTLGEFFKELRDNDPTVVPAYFTLEYLCARLAGGNIVAVRILSVALSLITIGLVYATGRYLFGGTAGLVAAALLAISRVHVYYSQEIRMYALFLPLAQLSLLTFIAAHNSKRRSLWIVNVLVNAAIVWTHLWGCILLFTEGLFILLFTRPRPFRRAFVWTLGHAPFLLLLGLWLSDDDLRRMNVAVNWISSPTWWSLFVHYFYFCSGSSNFMMECTRPHLLGLRTHALPGAFMIAASLWLLVWVFRHRVKTKFHPAGEGPWMLTFRSRVALPRSLRACPGYAPVPLLFLFIVFLVPPFVLFIISHEVKPYFVNRYVFYPAFAFCILAGAGAAVTPKGIIRVLAIALLLAPLLLQLTDLKRPLRSDMKTAARIIDAYGKPGDFVFTDHEVGTAVLKIGGVLSNMNMRSGPQYLDGTLSCVESGTSSWVIIPVYKSTSTVDFDDKVQRLGYKHDCFIIDGMVPLAVYRVMPYED